MPIHRTLVTLITALPLVASANLLTNGDFESQPNWGLGLSGDAGFSALTGTQIPGWTIEANHAATVHNTVLYPTISGAYSINMDGEGFFGNNANLYQDFATTSGQSYLLSFDWKTWFANTSPQLEVSVTDTLTAAVLYHASLAWAAGSHNETGLFTGTGNPLRLRIQENPLSGFNDNSFVVDNFSVTPAVPEPAGLGLMLSGFAVLGMRRRR